MIAPKTHTLTRTIITAVLLFVRLSQSGVVTHVYIKELVPEVVSGRGVVGTWSSGPLCHRYSAHEYEHQTTGMMRRHFSHMRTNVMDPDQTQRNVATRPSSTLAPHQCHHFSSHGLRSSSCVHASLLCALSCQYCSAIASGSTTPPRPFISPYCFAKFSRIQGCALAHNARQKRQFLDLIDGCFAHVCSTYSSCFQLKFNARKRFV